jgi:fatty-acyl-CoA synthase
MVAINTRLSAGEVEYIVEHSGSKMVFVDAELEELLEGVDESVEVIRIDDTGEKGDPYEDYLAEGSPEQVPSVLEDEEETISINYTSGTTGQPKGVMYTYRGAYLSALGNVIELADDYDDRYLWTPCRCSTATAWTLPLGGHGRRGDARVRRKVEPGRIWDLFESEVIPTMRGADGEIRSPTHGRQARARPAGHAVLRR